MTDNRDRLFAQTGLPVLRHVRELYGREEGKDAILLGKGPSLDRWDRSVPENTIVFALNESVLVSDRVDYALMIDNPVIRNVVAAAWQVPVGAKLIFRPLSPFGGLCEGDGGEPVVYMFAYKKDPIPRRQPSGGSALWIMHALGVKNVLMVGFDGFDAPADGSYAKVLEGRVDNPMCFEGRWNRPNLYIRYALDATGMGVTWFHRGDSGTPALSTAEKRPVVSSRIRRSAISK